LKRDLARRLRRDQTDVERKLWGALRNRRFSGFKFRRQQPVGPYIVDFVSFEAELVIELDGAQHGSDDGRAMHAARTAFLEGEGFRLRRFWNRELNESFEFVLDAIWNDLSRDH